MRSSSQAFATSALGSEDYVGPAREIVEARTGVPCLFLQGAAGNIMPFCGVGAGGPEQFDDLERVGAMLGGAALSLWASIRTHNTLGNQKIVQSVAVISTYEYTPKEEGGLEVLDDGSPALQVRSTRMTMPLAPYPPLDVARERLAMFEAERDAALERNAPAGVHNVAQRMYTWAKKIEEGAASGAVAPEQEVEVWSLRLNDISIVGVSGEALTELSLEVKERAVATTRGAIRHTIFCGYSNGCLGYIPPPKCFAEGGMEVVESTWNYNLPSQLTPAWAPAVVDTALRSLCALTGGDEETDVAAPSSDFILRTDEVFESDDGQIDGGVRYNVLLQVLVDFIRDDGGLSLPKDGIEEKATSGVEAEPAAGSSAKQWLCRPCKPSRL